MQKIKKILIIIGIFTLILTSANSNVINHAIADTPTPTPSSVPSDTPSTSDNSDQLQQLQDRITQLENKVNDLKSQETTLSSQIALMDNNIQLTQYRIAATEEQITQANNDITAASSRIKTLEGSVDGLTKVLINRIVATYQAGSAQPMQALLTSSDATDFLSRANYLRIVQAHDKQLLYDTQQAKVDYANQKNILEVKKQKVVALQGQLQDYTSQLDQQKKDKEDLLSSTKNDETHYQGMLDQARAQVNAFKSFATSRVGSGGSILPPQSSPDGWYYNQRDSRWGNNYIGSSSDSVWEVGCLVTSVAMVLKKHGNNVTPADVAGNGSYFVPTTASMLIPWGGGKFSTTWGYSQDAVDSKLSSGEPVIVGLHTGPYGMHFIVLKSGSGGNYVMNDPWNGPDLNFSDYYSTSMIFQFGYYNN